MPGTEMKYLKLTILILFLAPMLTVAEEPVTPPAIDGINGNVYCDHNKDGICDCKEDGLEGLHIQLFTEHCGGTPLQTIHTDDSGKFSFHVHESGTYYVMVDLDYVCGGRVPTTNTCQEVDYRAGEAVTLEPFGYSELGQ